MDVDAATLSQPLDEDIDGENKPDKTMMEEGGKSWTFSTAASSKQGNRDRDYREANGV